MGYRFYHHVVKVRFDEVNTEGAERENYYRFIDRRNAIGIGRGKTSHLIFNSDEKLDEKQISKELGGLAVLTLNVSEMRAA